VKIHYTLIYIVVCEQLQHAPRLSMIMPWHLRWKLSWFGCRSGI